MKGGNEVFRQFYLYIHLRQYALDLRDIIGCCASLMLVLPLDLFSVCSIVCF